MQVVVAVLLAVQFNAHSGQAIDKTIGTVVIVFICLFIAGFGWSWGPLVRPAGPLVVCQEQGHASTHSILSDNSRYRSEAVLSAVPVLM